MALHVRRESTLPRESLRTEIALERALIFVRVHIQRVHVQGVLVLVLFVAHCATVCVRIGVKSHVLQKRTTFEQFLIAANYVADSSLVYSSEMAVQ